VLSSPLNTRRWPRHHVDLPVRIIPLNGLLATPVHGCISEISRNGMAVHSSLALEPGDLMQVQFPISNPSTIRAVVRNRKDDCFGLEFLPQLSSGAQPNFVCNPVGADAPESNAVASYSCKPETVFAGLRRKQLQMKHLRREIEALNLAIVLLAEDEKKNPVSSLLPRRPELETRPWPSRSS
jgi:PilZ domain